MEWCSNITDSNIKWRHWFSFIWHGQEMGKPHHHHPSNQCIIIRRVKLGKLSLIGELLLIRQRWRIWRGNIMETFSTLMVSFNMKKVSLNLKSRLTISYTSNLFTHVLSSCSSSPSSYLFYFHFIRLFFILFTFTIKYGNVHLLSAFKQSPRYKHEKLLILLHFIIYY